jgi:hypothetical protein
MQMPKVVRPIKIVQVASSCACPLLLLHRRWVGPIVFLAEGDVAISILDPSRAVIPLLPNRGTVGREKAASILREAAPYPAEIYLVAVKTSAGLHGFGMVAVPVAMVPTFTTASTP